MIENFRLRVFRAVAQHLNFSRAAEELLLTQPAVTQQIKALEEELGSALFDRSGGKISLTPGGKALLPYVEQIRSLGDEAMDAIARANGQEAGQLTIGASQTIAQYLLPGFIAQYLQVQPRVHVAIRSGNTDAMLEALVAKEIQIALIEGPEQRQGIRVEPFMEDQMVLVVPTTHRWAKQKIRVDDLKNEPLLFREFGSGSRRIVESALTEKGIRKRDLSIVMELDSTEGLLRAVEAGLGVTFVSQWAARNQIALGTLKIAHVHGLKITRHFSFALPEGPKPKGNTGSFRRFLLELSH